MTDQPQGKTPDESPNVQTDKANGKTPLESLPADVQEYIRELRRENEKRRKTEDDIKAAAEDEKRKAEEAALAQQQKWQELAEKRAKELDALKPVEQRYKALEEAFVAALAKRIDKVPDAYKSALELISDPIKQMAWLDANDHLFEQRQAPKLDAGAQGDATSKTTPKLTEGQSALTAIANQLGFNVKAENVAASAQRLEEQRRRQPRKDEE
jgi:hypothetical protein